jgi:hypothetical protein
MGRVLAPLAVCAALITLARAGIVFTKPKASDKLTAGTAIEVEWKEGGSGPSLADIATFDVVLCAGGNDVNSIVSSQVTKELISILIHHLRNAASLL